MRPAEIPDSAEPSAGITLIRAGAIAGFDDAAGSGDGAARPGAVAAADGAVIDSGSADDLTRRYAVDAKNTVDCPDRLLLPGFVNAHTHFELNAIGPQPYTGSFTEWVRMLVDRRPSGTELIGRSVAEAVSMSVAAATDAIGDIGGGRLGEAEAWRILRDAPLSGVYFPELIGLGGESADNELERLNELLAETPQAGRMRRGVSPHAPYSTGRKIYEAATKAAVDHELIVTTHLAEMTEEHRFVADASGPFREFLESLGVWKDRFAVDYRDGYSAVQWMEPYLRRTPWLVAHCNYVTDDDIALLAETEASVAYCPVASEYFGHTGHRYRDMLDAGVNVCLGTDSIVCQPPDELQPLGILPQMRRLYQRDQTDPAVLLRMATSHGRRALQLDSSIRRLASVRFDPENPADPLTQVLQGNDPVVAIELSNG
ncbi:MAG: amidohydrolase family protein [Planctomycetota bacterium]